MRLGLRALLTVLVIGGGMPGTGSAQTPGLTRERWLGLTARYRKEPSEAVAALLEWSPRQLSHVVRSVRGSEKAASDSPPGEAASCSDACLRLGAVMHVEAAMVAHESGKPPLRMAHLDVATGLLRLTLKSSGPTPFTARCRLAAGLVYQSARWSAQARSLFEEAQQQLAEDPQPAFALALLDLDLAARTGLGCDQSATAGQRRPSAAGALAFHRAEEGLRRTLERSPTHAEAHLRLGHLLLSAGRKADAAIELQWVREKAERPAERFTAELLLGSLADGEGHTEAAAAHYRAALELAPRAQVARVALSDVLHRTGRRDPAHELMADLVSEGPTPGDEWLSYCTPDPSQALWSLLPELRSEAEAAR